MSNIYVKKKEKARTNGLGRELASAQLVLPTELVQHLHGLVDALLAAGPELFPVYLFNDDVMQANDGVQFLFGQGDGDVVIHGVVLLSLDDTIIDLLPYNVKSQS